MTVAARLRAGTALSTCPVDLRAIERRQFSNLRADTSASWRAWSEMTSEQIMTELSTLFQTLNPSCT